MSTTLKRMLALSSWMLCVLCATAEPAVEDVVHQVVRAAYYHGLPYQLAHGLGPEAVPTLLELLERDEEREHWANVVTVLGMIGDDRATEPLIDFLERRFTGRVDGAAYRALLEVPASLGLLARDPSSRAFAYLVDGTSLEAWQGRALPWVVPPLQPADRDLLMLRRSIVGLGFSGTEAGRESLLGVRRSLVGSNLERALRDNIAEALWASERIQDLGYERFFDSEIELEPYLETSPQRPEPP